MKKSRWSYDRSSRFVFEIMYPSSNKKVTDVFLWFVQNLPFVSDEISGTPLPRKVTVKNVCSGNVWRMEMTTNGESNTVLLRDGWKKIVKDKNLKEPIFLVFEFDGSRVFHFCLYEHRSMCKKMTSPLEKEVIEVESEEEEEGEEDDVIGEDEENTKELNESPKRKERGVT